MRSAKIIFGVANYTDFAALQDFPRSASAAQKSKFVVNQRQHIDTGGFFRHFPRFVCRHRHRLFAQNVLAVFEREQSHFLVKNRRRGDADQINRFVFDCLAPIARVMRDAEITRRHLGVFRVCAGNRDDFHVFNLMKRGNLHGFGETRSDNSDANFFFHYQKLKHKIRKRKKRGKTISARF